jgi:hypothetical protein
MPRIEQVPMDELAPDARRVIEEAFAAGRLRHPQMAQTIAHSPRMFPGFIAAIVAGPYSGAEKTFGARFCELLRIRSAQIAGCGPCSESRYDKSLSEETIACAIVNPAGLSKREQLAVRLLAKFHADYQSIDDQFFRELGGVFTIVEIVELLAYVSGMVGGHRMLHVLDLLGEQEPVIRYDRAERARAFGLAAESDAA